MAQADRETEKRTKLLKVRIYLKQHENSDVITLSDGSVLVMRLKTHKAPQERPLF